MLGNGICRIRKKELVVSRVSGRLAHMEKIREYGIYLTVLIFILAMTGLVLAHDSGDSIGINNPVINAPEFPTIFLPVTMIIGILGAIVMVKLTRDQ